MTTAQIIILSILFLVDLGHLIFIIRRIHDETVVFPIVKTFLIWTILITAILAANHYAKELKCPEYEKIEDAYRLKK